MSDETGTEDLRGDEHHEWLERRQRRLARSPRPAPPAPEHRRWVAVGLVAVAMVLVGASAASSHASSRSGAAGTVSPEAALPSVAAAAASSSAWYCPGPLPVGTGAPGSSIALTGTGDKPRSAQLTISSSAGGATTETVTVPAGGTIVAPVRRTGHRAIAAVTVVVRGGGVAATELLDRPGVPTSAPCQDETSTEWLFPSGSTVAGSNVLVSLFDPTTSPADVDVSFATPATAGATGGSAAMVGPPPFQGLAIQPGQVMLLDVAKQFQLKRALATEVSTTSGRVVAGELISATIAGTPYSELASGSGSPHRDWLFPLASQANGDDSTYWVFDPSPAPSRVKLVLSLGAAGSTSLEVTVPGSSVALVTPSAVAAAARHGAPVRGPLVAAEVESVSGPSVVASRGAIVVVPSSRPRGQGRSTVVLEPWTMLGDDAAATSWLLPLAGVVGPLARAGHAAPMTADRGSVFLTTTGKVAVHVTLQVLDPSPASVAHFGAGGFSGTGALRRLTATVVPGRSTRVPFDAIGPARAILVTSAGGPVAVEADLYVVGSSGGDASSGLPAGG